LVGAAVGLFNGLSVSWLKVPSFLVTLASRMFFAGAAVWYTTFHTSSSSIADLPASFTNIADGYIFSFQFGTQVIGLPVPVAVAIVVVIGAHLILSRSALGRSITAVGANPKTAHISGLPVGRTITLAFVISGICASIAGILYSSRMETGSPITGENILLDVIGAVVIGGTSLFGGKGKIVWTVFGVLFLVLLDMTLKLFGASLFLIYIIKGSVILAAAIIDTLRNHIFADR
jgi:ribose/xylose/arabinose/galactoside ABC-type transport system permease subunit